MDVRKIIAIVLVVIGGAMLGVSYYIKNEVAEGRIKVQNAERSVEKGKSLFSITPYTKPIGEGIAKSADKKIQEAKHEIGYYERMAQMLQIGGIIAIIVGGIIFLTSYKKRR